MSKRIEVTSWNQKLVAYDGSKSVFEFDCVLGDSETPTRPGSFRITWKDPHHISSQSHRPMPHAMFFDQGRAIHGGNSDRGTPFGYAGEAWHARQPYP